MAPQLHSKKMLSCKHQSRMSCASCHSALLDGQIGLGSLIGKMAELATHDLFHFSSRSEIYMVIYESESDCFSVVSDSLSMEFSRSEYWSGQPFPSPGDLPNPGNLPNPGLPHCRQILYQLSHQGRGACNYKGISIEEDNCTRHVRASSESTIPDCAIPQLAETAAPL